jgi:hypothetical protein
MKSHANAREIEFKLDYFQFVTLAIESGYHAKSGILKNSLQIDRKDANRGYEWGNVRVIKMLDNARKGGNERGRYRHKPEEEEIPF